MVPTAMWIHCTSARYSRAGRSNVNVRTIRTGLLYYGPDSTFKGTHYRADGTVRVEPKATYETVLERVISVGKNCVEKGEHLFLKEMSKFAVGKYHLYVEGGMADFQHTFIIRDPLASAWSWYRCVPPSREYENGFDRLYEMYKAVKSNLDENPMVITAEDLFSRPRCVHDCQNSNDIG